MKISEMQSVLKTLWHAKQYNTVVTMHSLPGIGKSSIVKQTADDLGIKLYDLRLSQLTPVDLRGVPYVDTQITYFAQPSYLPRDSETESVLFLDEFNQAPPAMMAIAQQLLLDRRVGDYKLPNNCFLVTAGNPISAGAAVFGMPSPVANRMLHYGIEPDIESFTDYALQKQLDSGIIGYLNWQPSQLHSMPTVWGKVEGVNLAYPTPRSWEMASTLHGLGLDISAAVGSASANSFYNYIKVYQYLPDVKEILQRGEKSTPPNEYVVNEKSARYALVMLLLHSIAPDWDITECVNAIAYIATFFSSKESLSLLYCKIESVVPKGKLTQIVRRCNDYLSI